MSFPNTEDSFTYTVEMSYKSRTSILSQPIFLAKREILSDYIWIALFEKVHEK